MIKRQDSLVFHFPNLLLVFVHTTFIHTPMLGAFIYVHNLLCLIKSNCTFDKQFFHLDLSEISDFPLTSLETVFPLVYM